MLVVIAIVLPMLLIGVGIVWYARRSRAQIEASKGWPTVQGTIASSSCQRRLTDANVYVAVVNFTYQVSGRDYQGNRLSFGGKVDGNEDEMNKFVAEYPAGKIIPVYYDPQNPAVALLRPDMTGGATVMLWVGLVVTALAIALGVMVLALAPR
jgi:hypothetical protein